MSESRIPAAVKNCRAVLGNRDKTAEKNGYGGTMDYKKYRLERKDHLICLLAGIAISGVIAGLFYRSCWAMLLCPLVCIVWKRKYRAGKLQKRKDRLLLEFKDAMQAVSAALLAGYSMENAWKEAEGELRELHGEESLMCRELHLMNAAVRMNEPLEKVLSEFAQRSGCEEIESFAEVFSFAKRGGGDFAGMIRTTVQKLAGRIEVEREIATILAGKKLEGRVMNVMPVLILAYLTAASGGFLDSLYKNTAGVLVMTTALAVYVAAMALSEHIMNIRI